MVFTICHAQDTVFADAPLDQRVFMIEGGGSLYFPQNAFARNVDHTLYGINIGGFAQVIKSQPLFAGFGLSFAGLGSFNSAINRQFDTGPIEQWDSSTGSKIVGFHFTGRYFLDIGSQDIMPFLELQAGSNFFYTSTNLTFPGSDESSSSFDKSDFIGFYGGGGGLSISMTDRIYLTTRVNVVFGQSGKYFIKARDFLDNPFSETIDAFDLKQTSTDMILWNIGLTYTF